MFLEVFFLLKKIMIFIGMVMVRGVIMLNVLMSKILGGLMFVVVDYGLFLRKGRRCRDFLRKGGSFY